MTNEYYGTATTPTEDFLAHYGVRGMKWGVRKALMKGNEKRLARNFAKAEKKLAKLQKRAKSGDQYKKRAALLGAGAAAAGGLAIAGTKGISAGLKALGGTGKAIGEWGAKHTISRGVTSGLADLGTKIQARGSRFAKGSAGQIASTKAGLASWNAAKKVNKANLSNNTIARIGAGAVGTGLGIAAGYNAYRAATTKRAAAKAKQFRSEMNKAFAGTKYANKRPSSHKKRRK